MATDKIRPCTAAELLAFQYMKDATQNPKFASHVQQSFIDERDHVPSPSPRKKKARSATAASEKHIAPAAASESVPEMPDFINRPGDSSDEEICRWRKKVLLAKENFSGEERFVWRRQILLAIDPPNESFPKHVKHQNQHT